MTLPKRYNELQYMPNVGVGDRQSKAGRPLKYQYRHRIAYTETVCGLDDNIPSLLFLGAPFALLRDACKNIHKMMTGKVRDLIVTYEHSCRVKNGKHYWRNVVGIIGLDERFISVKEFITLFISYIQRLCNCTVRRYKLESFLNL